MANYLKARTPFLAIIFSLFAVGYTLAQEVIREQSQKVVVIPMGGDSSSSPDLSSLEARVTALENAAPSIESRLNALEGAVPNNLDTRLLALEGSVQNNSNQILSLQSALALLAQNGVPSGVVVPFNSSTCPTGWEKYTNAQGRFVVGLNDGGEIGYTAGLAFNDKDGQLSHQHTWVRFETITKDWVTYDSEGHPTLMMNWGDGIDNSGVGWYPIAVDDSVTDNPAYYYTNKSGNGNPYVQLLYCEKV